MTNANHCRPKKRILIHASQQGVEKAEKALVRLSFDTKSNFAKANRLGKSGVDKFFTRQPIQVNTFIKICAELKLNWKEIVDLPEKEKLERLENNCSISNSNKEVDRMQEICRQVTITDIDTETQKVEITITITLRGDKKNIRSNEIIRDILREYSGDSTDVVDVKEGSIKLIIKGSQEDIQRLVSQIESKELTEVDGFPIESVEIFKIIEGSQEDIQRFVSQIKSKELTKVDGFPIEDVQIVQIIDKDAEDNESVELDRKWDLVKEIVSQPVEGRNLFDIDLSDADLSGACLKYANLTDADLSSADLSGADLSGAYLSYADLSGADLSYANLSGANLHFTMLTDANLNHVNLRGTKMGCIDSSEIKIYNKLNSVRIILNNPTYHKNFSGKDLSNADLSDADLSRADLSRANLSGTNLSNAYLSGAKLSDANLSSANLSGADLSNADLSNADLSDADLRQVKNLTLKQLRSVINSELAHYDPEVRERIGLPPELPEPPQTPENQQ